jgi:hypothetical protein
VNENGVASACLAQETPIVVPIVIIQEDRASVHPSLGDMHGNTGYFDPCLAWHRAGLVETPAVFLGKLPAGIGEIPVRR